jgi:8-oxo-dGTP pyrophosphatase MutT (NUDIX family)
MAKTQIPSSDLVVDGTKSPEDIVAEIVHVIKKGTNAAYTADKHVQPAIEPSLGYIMESKTASHNQSAIMNLRRFIGHMPLLTISAGVILENSKGEVLLERRLDNGMWADIGGALEPGESLEDCAKRELFEESGLTAHSLELFEIFSGQPPHTYPNGDVCENTGVLYICRDFSGELKAQEDEVLEFRWFSLDEIINNMDQISKPSRIIFEKYIEKRRKEAG